MGCFGYICPVCNTQIVGDCFNGGELCRLKHVRQGKLIGETVGHYNEYGGVMEDKDYRGEDHTVDGASNPNSHSEICDSEFGRADSHHFGSNKILPSGDILSTSCLSLTGILVGNAEYQLVEYLQNGINTNPVVKSYAKKIIEAVNYAELLRRKCWETHNKEDRMKARKAEFDVYILVDNDGDEDYKKFKEAVWELVSALPIAQGSSGTIAVHEKCYQSLSKEEQDKLPFSLPDPDQSWGEVREEFV